MGVTPRTLDELLNTTESAWSDVGQWVSSSKNVRILPRNETQTAETLLYLQVTTRSTLGAVAWETGGILIDSGWVRLLGSGSVALPGSLRSWNDGEKLHIPDALIVAYDAIGGFFALDGGAFSAPNGNVHYFSPDTLQWEDLKMTYSGFVHWLCIEPLAQFYSAFRWPGWETDVAALPGDQGFSIYPPLWAAGGPIAERSRRSVPVIELWGLQREIAAQLNNSQTKGHA